MRPMNLLRSAFVATLLFGSAAVSASAQVRDAQEWLDQCRRGEHYRDDSRERACELREVTLAADGRTLTVDGRQNGGISVEGWDRNEILVQALISAVAPTVQQAQADARAVRIQTADATVRAEGPGQERDSWWSVSYRVYVPRQTDLDLRAQNGGLRLQNVSGRIQLETRNGGITLTGVSGDVRGRTANGGLNVRLDGRSWQGAGLDLRTSNGGINLHVPEGYSAQLETGTVNGRIRTEIPITVQGELRRDLSTQLGQGGAPIRVQTTNGSVRIHRS